MGIKNTEEGTELKYGPGINAEQSDRQARMKDM